MNNMNVRTQLKASYSKGRRIYHHNGYHNLHNLWFPHRLRENFKPISVSKYSRRVEE